MARKKISQADARRYRKERDAARELVNTLFVSSGRHIGSQPGTHELTLARIRTARTLGYTVLAIPSITSDELIFRAVKPREL